MNTANPAEASAPKKKKRKKWLPFVLIAFLGVLSTRDILMMIAFQYFMKLGIEVLFGTPLAYVVILALKRSILKVRHNG